VFYKNAIERIESMTHLTRNAIQPINPLRPPYRRRRSMNLHAIIMIALLALMLCGHSALAGNQEAQGDDTNDFIKDWNVNKKWKGDFDGMAKRKVIRVLVVPNLAFYSLDKGIHRGLIIELFREFDKHINGKNYKKPTKIKIMFIPVARDQIIPWLVDGIGDIAAANLTITPERKKDVDFSDPLLSNVKEILVTGPSAPSMQTIDDLSGKELHVRKSSSYYEHVVELNQRFKKEKKKPVKIIPISDILEDSDLLEMVSAGLLPMAIVDDHKANFWVQILKDLKLHPDIAVHEGGAIAWAFRKQSPKLTQKVNAFVKKSKKGTTLGNILFKRYLTSTKWVKNAMSPSEMKKYQTYLKLFQTYSDQYEFDFLMTAALSYQESQFDHSKRSSVGAVGLMQLLPETAADKNVGIKNIQKVENNVHAGHKYLRFLQDRYFDDPAIDELNKNLFTFAAYNAGPAKIAKLRKEAKKKGLNPNVWFHNVEIIAGQRIGRETVQYVSNIYKYYVAYKLSKEKNESAKKIKKEISD
jgi:membrane-bound lytic murein transglycosylase MltF